MPTQYINAQWISIRPSFLVFQNLMKCLNSRETVVGVEVGVREGLNAALMLEACPQLELLLVDIQELPELHLNLKNFSPDRYNFIRGASVDVARTIRDKSLNYIYIDADHTYPEVLKDLRAWYPKLATGGIIGGHDWTSSEVRQAVMEFFGQEYPEKRLCYCAEIVNNPDEVVAQLDAEMMDWWISPYEIALS